MKPDVIINGVSMRSLGWLREAVDFPTPQSQSNTIVVPGRNSPIRYTEALGRVAYEPRSFEMTFTMLGRRAYFDDLVSNVVNRFAGRLCQVVLTEDPTIFAVGTLEAAPSYSPLTGRGELILSCDDGDSFLYHTEETIVSITGGGTIVLANDYMPLVPAVMATAETTLRWAIDGESFIKTISAGTWEIPELELRHGNNTVSVTGEGVVTFTYREGRL
ncbi:MAG: hypothetical protein IJ179_01105 [Oscillospiraceae bacterium]|nr:hypothetical protein [Oscillospiraceae bacterium]